MTHILTADRIGYGLQYGPVLRISMDWLVKNRDLKMLSKLCQKRHCPISTRIYAGNTRAARAILGLNQQIVIIYYPANYL